MAAAPSRAAGDRENVFNRLPLLRADRGISRSDLAEALGIHYQTIGYIERGESRRAFTSRSGSHSTSGCLSRRCSLSSRSGA